MTELFSLLELFLLDIYSLWQFSRILGSVFGWRLYCK